MAAVVFGAMSTVSAAEEWNVLRAVSGVLTDSRSMTCFAAPRTAEAGEEKVGGPYSSESEAEAAIGNLPGCREVPE